MATPTLAGCYAALCSLYGDVESPSSFAGASSAAPRASFPPPSRARSPSGGRFVFDEAVQAAGALNPTSYALTFEDGAQRFTDGHDGATVTIDSTPASATAAP